ncbi:hypothetical protein FK268_06565 [Tsukamurella sputi]|uniref:Uncharacterized protein n=1 Tax=Tsukamurella sputi TaxID=2591848 RepID=A0A5C5RRP8_9ACTN|nr:hypothetical protein [Tsukamurella sputi]TWS24901.1 hypothetical protein FK268_06565 [Tsukamurella sputi]
MTSTSGAADATPLSSSSDRIAADEAGDVARGLSVGAGAAVLFLLLRLLAVANWNWNTATQIMAVTDVDGALTMFFGTLMADPGFTGGLVALLLPLSFLRLVWPINGTRSGIVDTGLTLALLVAAAVALSATYRYVWVPIAAAVIGAVFVAMRLFWRHGVLHRATQFLFRRAAIIAGIGLLAIAGLVETPWVPLEDVVTRTETVHGYVLKAEPGFLTVLTEPDREVRVLTTADVLERR